MHAEELDGRPGKANTRRGEMNGPTCGVVAAAAAVLLLDASRMMMRM